MQELLARDQVISALYPETEELVNREILLQAPVADDLRFLLSVLRILDEWSSPTISSCRSHPGQPHSRRGSVAEHPGDYRAYGEPGR